MKLKYKKPLPEISAFSDRKQRIYGFLVTTPWAVLSTIGPNKEPHGVVIYYVIDKQFRISFLTKKGTKKYDNLKRNNKVILTVFEPLSQTTAQVIGLASEITDNYKINQVAQQVFDISKKSDSGLPPISKLDAGEFTAFSIKPKQIRMAVYARPDGGDYSEMFDSLESFELNVPDI